MKKFIQIAMVLALFFSTNSFAISTVGISSDSVLVGDTFDVLVNGDFDVDVIGGGFDLGFNSAVVAVNSVNFDPVWNFLTSATIDNGAGTVTDAFFNSFPALSAGPRNIATISLTALSVGLSDLTLTDNLNFPFANTDGAFPVTLANGLVTVDVVNAVPLPAAVWFFATAIAGLGFLRKKTA